MPDEGLRRKDVSGQTPLHVAAWHGNVEVAEILVRRDYNLLYVHTQDGLFPIHFAARNHRKSKDAFLYFFRLTKDDEYGQPNPYECSPIGVSILVNLIGSKFYDLALKLVKKYPDLGRHNGLCSNMSALDTIVRFDCPIINKHNLSFWQSFIYYCVSKGSTSAVLGKSIVNKMVMHQEAVKLLKCLCDQLKTLNEKQVLSLTLGAMFRATSSDICNVILNIVEAYPLMAYSTNSMGQNILHAAVENRSENVFNLVCGTRVLRSLLSDSEDRNKNSVLHLAGKLAPPHKLNLVSGAALQMQRELQWFKEVQKIAPSYCLSFRNVDDKTPNMIFTEEHKGLKEGGEKWMKDTATSCTIAAVLIVTVVFAAAITVPGGNNGGNGLPIFSNHTAFTVFAISNAATLYTSTTSLLVFLSILTSRYAEQDFLYALPKRLIIGLFTLFLSIIFMMIAYSATVYLVVGHNRRGVLIIVAALACLPVTSFVLLQFPLLVALVSSTYGRGIFDHRGFPQLLV
ncbi:ankyrin repeat-containing protein NPR4-like [Ipomoea triloba]|uniref:ankyrin repeat-containing protein NPR4-like n=1 Tax=Ipomoea triloba TaxID=35885 RepID=UPI00125D1CE4|nr:ankyrin repeat-containing protein NPR4-like [Ipomoea triloba]